jgi:methylenetetrahydrofolate dehydrogenase (NADP+)/methenyltetrahydrofolate cyclohydrolase
MTAKILNGKEIAAKITQQLKVEAERFKMQGINPTLAVIQVGDNPASQIYVRQKIKKCAEVGIASQEHILPSTVSKEELLALVSNLNHDPSVHGLLIQLPLPKDIDEVTVLESIDPNKDVDGFHAMNIGRLISGLPTIEPCTPKGILSLIEETGYPIAGANAVVIGRSNIVGKPVAMMLLARDATVTITHSKTKDLREIVRRADILVAAVGRPNFVTADMVKDGAVVIDVGINRLDSGLVGDVDTDAAAQKASWITPVPGGVGPMTIAMLLHNTLSAAAIQQKKEEGCDSAGHIFKSCGVTD